MTIATFDDRKRVRIPDARPGQQVSVVSHPDGSWTVSPVQEVESKERFPRGSLLKYITPEYNREQEAIFRGMVKGPE